MQANKLDLPIGLFLITGLWFIITGMYGLGVMFVMASYLLVVYQLWALREGVITNVS